MYGVGVLCPSLQPVVFFMSPLNLWCELSNDFSCKILQAAEIALAIGLANGMSLKVDGHQVKMGMDGSFVPVHNQTGESCFQTVGDGLRYSSDRFVLPLPIKGFKHLLRLGAKGDDPITHHSCI